MTIGQQYMPHFPYPEESEQASATKVVTQKAPSAKKIQLTKGSVLRNVVVEQYADGHWRVISNHAVKVANVAEEQQLFAPPVAYFDK